MTERISLPKLRANEGEVPYDETVAALVEAVEVAKRLLETKPEAIVKGHAYVDLAPGLYELHDALARFDFEDA